MPYVIDNEDQQSGGTYDQNPMQSYGSQSTSGPLTLDQSSAPTSSSSSYSQKPSSSGSFTNLQSYINANSGDNTGSHVASKLNQEGQQYGANLGNYQSQFNQQAASGYNPEDQSGVAQDLASTSSSSGPSTDQIKNFQGQYNDKYAGPQSLDTATYSSGTPSWNSSYQGAQGLQTDLTNYGTSGGQKAILQEQYGSRPHYTQGEQNLDQLFMQNDPTTRGAFQNLQSQYGNVGGQYDQANTAAQGTAATDTANAQKAAADAQSAYNTTQGDWNTGVQDTNTAAKNRVNAYDAAATTAAQTHNLSPLDQYTNNFAGYTGGNLTYGANPLSFIHAVDPSALATNASTMTQGEASQGNNLNALLGGNTSQYTAGQYADPSAQIAFDASGLNSAVGAGQDQYRAQQAQLGQLERANQGGAYGSGTYSSLTPGVGAYGTSPNNINTALGATLLGENPQDYLTASADTSTSGMNPDLVRALLNVQSQETPLNTQYQFGSQPNPYTSSNSWFGVRNALNSNPQER
jgi:hypothetical protein